MELVLLDRDGVINYDSEKYIKNLDEFEIIPESIEGIVNLTQAGIKVVICTNQSGIGRGLFTMKELNEMHQFLHQEVNQAGGKIDAIMICPHVPEDNCQCRKPKPGLVIDICERFNIDDMTRVMFVGDSIRDLETIDKVGGVPILVKTGNGKKTLIKEKLPSGTLVFENLLAASEYIVEHIEKERENEE